MRPSWNSPRSFASPPTTNDSREPGGAAAIEQLAQVRLGRGSCGPTDAGWHGDPGPRPPRPARSSPRCRDSARRSRSPSASRRQGRRPPTPRSRAGSARTSARPRGAQRVTLLVGSIACRLPTARHLSSEPDPSHEATRPTVTAGLRSSHVRVREARLLLVDPRRGAPRRRPRRSRAPRTRRASSSRSRSPASIGVERALQLPLLEAVVVGDRRPVEGGLEVRQRVRRAEEVLARPVLDDRVDRLPVRRRGPRPWRARPSCPHWSRSSTNFS